MAALPFIFKDENIIMGMHLFAVDSRVYTGISFKI